MGDCGLRFKGFHHRGVEISEKKMELKKFFLLSRGSYATKRESV